MGKRRPVGLEGGASWEREFATWGCWCGDGVGKLCRGKMGGKDLESIVEWGREGKSYTVENRQRESKRRMA